MPDSLKLVYMGTPDFAVPALKALHGSRHAILQVVTQPDRPKGRGRKPVAPPVKEAALALDLTVIQPESIRTAAFHEHLRGLNPDAIVLIAYGNLLPESILKIPPHGAVNIHASLLPRYRGSAPIQWALIRGETVTGVTAMMMDRGMDTGDILGQTPIAILEDDTSGTLHDRLSVKGAELLLTVLDQMAAGILIARPQDPDQATCAPLLKKEDGRIDWSLSAQAIACLIRGVTPWPAATTTLGDLGVKIYRAKALPDAATEPAGTVVPGFPDELRVCTGQGILLVLELQGSSGKRLSAAEFMRGRPIPPGSRFV